MHVRTSQGIEALTYPGFVRSRLDDAEEQRMAAELAALEDRHGLFDGGWQVGATASFIRHCSPPGTRPGALEIATHFLYTWYFLHGWQRMEDPHRVMGAVWDVARGLPAPFEHPALACLAEARDRMAAGPEASMHSFLHFLGRTLSGFLWEHEHQGELPDAERYAAVRTNTISTQPYFEAWKLAMGTPQRLEVSYGIDLRRLEDRARRLQYLANDLCSVDMDSRTGKRNLVFLLARDQGLPIEVAHATLWQTHDDEAVAMLEDDARVRADHPDAELARALDFVQSCTVGNATAMIEIRSRYAL